MASQYQLANWNQWIADNPDKQGTDDFNVVQLAISRAAQPERDEQEVRRERRRRQAENKAARAAQREATEQEVRAAIDAQYAEAAEREAAPDYADMSALRRGFSRGIDSAGVMAGSATEGLGKTFDSDYLIAKGREQIAENEAQLAQQEKYVPATRLKDVTDINTFLDYFLETLGETAPLTGASIAAALAAPVVLPAGVGAVGAAAVGTAAAAATQLPFFYGGNREAQKDAIAQGLKLEVDEGAAFLSAIPQATLDVIAERITLFGGRMLPGAAAAGGLFTRGVKAARRGVVSEVPTELGQQVIERAQANLDLTSDEAIDGYIEVAAAAALIGGTIGGVSGLAGVGKAPPPPPLPSEIPVVPDVPLDDPTGLTAEEPPLGEDKTPVAGVTAKETPKPITAEEQVVIDKILNGDTLTKAELKVRNTNRIAAAVEEQERAGDAERKALAAGALDRVEAAKKAVTEGKAATLYAQEKANRAAEKLEAEKLEAGKLAKKEEEEKLAADKLTKKEEEEELAAASLAKMFDADPEEETTLEEQWQDDNVIDLVTPEQQRKFANAIKDKMLQNAESSKQWVTSASNFAAEEIAKLEAEELAADKLAAAPVVTPEVDVDTLTPDQQNKLLNDLEGRIGKAAPVVDAEKLAAEKLAADKLAAENRKKVDAKFKANTERGKRFAPKMGDGLLPAIARLGGINRSELKGMGLEDYKGTKKGNKYVFSENGLPLDRMVEALIEQHYLYPQPKDSPATTDINRLLDHLNEALLDPYKPYFADMEPPQSYIDAKEAEEQDLQAQYDADRERQAEEEEQDRLADEGKQAAAETADRKEETQDLAIAEEAYGPNFEDDLAEYSANVIEDPDDAVNKLLDKVDDGTLSWEAYTKIAEQGGRTAPPTGEVVTEEVVAEEVVQGGTAPPTGEVVAEEIVPEEDVQGGTAPPTGEVVTEEVVPEVTEEVRVSIDGELLDRFGFKQRTAFRTRLTGDKYKDQTFTEEELIAVLKAEAGKTRTQINAIKAYEKKRAAGEIEFNAPLTTKEQLAATDDTRPKDVPDSYFIYGPRYEGLQGPDKASWLPPTVVPAMAPAGAEGETQDQLNERIGARQPPESEGEIPPKSTIKVTDGYATEEGADKAGETTELSAEEIKEYANSAVGLENRRAVDTKIARDADAQAAKDSIAKARVDRTAVTKIGGVVNQFTKINALSDKNSIIYNTYVDLWEGNELGAEEYLQDQQVEQGLTDKEVADIRNAAHPTFADRSKWEAATSSGLVSRDLRDALEDGVFPDDATLTTYEEGFDLLASAVASNAEPINNIELRDAIASGNMGLTISTLAKTSSSKLIKNMSRKLEGKVAGIKVEVRKNLRNSDGRLVAGHFDPETNTLLLDIDRGLNTHTLLHETYHALTIAPLRNKSNPATKQLQTLFDDTKDDLGSIYGARSLEEFVAEAQSNSQFRTALARINPKGGELSALQRFTNIMRRLVNNLLGTKFNSGDALTAADTLIESILAPEPNSRNANYLLENSTFDDMPKVVGELLEDPQKALQAMPAMASKDWKKGALRLLATNGGVGIAQQGFWKTMDMNRFRWVGEAIGTDTGDIVKRIQKTSDGIRADQNAYEEKANIVASSMQSWITSSKDVEGEATLDKLIYDKDIGVTIQNVNPLLSRGAAKKVYNAEEMIIWDKQRELVNKLQGTVDSKTGKNGMHIYREMRDHYTNTLNELNSTITGVIEDLPTLSKEQKTKLTSDVFEKMFDKNFTDTYFPLIRQGRYKVAYTVVNPISLEGAKGDSTVVEMVDTFKQAKHLVSELQSDPEVAEVLNMEQEGIIDTKYENRTFIKSAPPKAYVNKLLNELQGMEVPAGVSDLVVSTFIDFLPETSFAHSLRQRKNTVGYIPSAKEAMLTKGYDIGRQSQRIKGMAKLGNVESEISTLRAGYDVDKYPVTAAVFNRFFEEVDSRLSFMRSPPNDALWKNINQYGFIYTIGFNASSAAVNLSQIPLFVMPYLMPIYGTAAVTKTFLNAGSLVGGTGRLDLGSKFSKKRLIGMDAYYKFSVDDKGVTTFGLDEEAIPADKLEEVRAVEPLLKGLVDRGQLNKGGFLFEQLRADEGGMPRGARGLARRWVDVITETSAVAFNAAERFNRQVSAIGIYQLELAKRVQDAKTKGSTLTDAEIIKSFDATTIDEIVDHAIRTTISVNGNTFLETAAPITQKGFLRSAMMYKGFGFQMYHTMLRAGMQAIDNAFPKNAGSLEAQAESRKLRNQAVQQLMNWHLSTLFFAGVAGTPLYGMLEMMFDMYYDDEEQDFATRVRTSEYMNEAFFKGFITAGTGADVSARVRLNGLVVQANRYNSRPSPEEFIGFHMGGPSLSSVKRNVRGMKDLTEGNWYRGVENLLPPAFANFFKASPVGRLQREGGYLTRRGDPIYDDVSTGEIASQMFGFAPAEYTKRQEENMAIKKIDIAIGEKSSKLLKKYYMAVSMDNDEEEADAFNDILEFNDRHPDFAISARAIIRSLRSHFKTTATLHNGVALSRKMQRVMDAYLFEKDQHTPNKATG